MKKSVILLSVILFCFGVYCTEATPVSYFENLNTVIISGNTSFDLENIDFICGGEVDNIIIKSIPPIDFGSIEYQNQTVSKNDIFTRKQIKNLTLKINTSDNISCKAEFSYIIGEEIFNGIFVFNSKESTETPECDNISITAYQNSVYTGKLIGKSNKKCGYYIENYPASGSVILNRDNGVFKYYPKEKAITDSFSYRVYDCCGNLSQSKTVYIKIVCNKDSVSYNNSAECFFDTEQGYIKTVGNKIFAPQLPVTKSEFLVGTMNILKLNELQNCKGTVSVFSDFGQISVTDRGYVSYALSHGIIEKSDAFNPKDRITRAQACKIFQNLLNIEMIPTYTDFDDETDISDSEQGAVYSLYSVGAILPKDNRIKPNDFLTVSDYAIMLQRLNSLYPKRFD